MTVGRPGLFRKLGFQHSAGLGDVSHGAGSVEAGHHNVVQPGTSRMTCSGLLEHMLHHAGFVGRS